ncbi:Protein mesA [Fusarium oxysporum f. sp. albedinis]|nr:Protein mesA [Fusarium oxysporum f. sp. albedinis]
MTSWGHRARHVMPIFSTTLPCNANTHLLRLSAKISLDNHYDGTPASKSLIAKRAVERTTGLNLALLTF